jgi:hypothetical protein
MAPGAVFLQYRYAIPAAELRQHSSVLPLVRVLLREKYYNTVLHTFPLHGIVDYLFSLYKGEPLYEKIAPFARQTKAGHSPFFIVSC